jgi:transposase-like protein
LSGDEIQFFLLIAAFFNANAKDHHQQYPQLQQERRSVAGGFKRAARELHVIRKIKGTGMVHGIVTVIVYCDCLL